LSGNISTFDDEDRDDENNCGQNQDDDEKDNPAVDTTLVFGHSRHLFAN